jgi:arylsulfatase A-like enzyme
LIGKWHLGDGGIFHPNQRGFDEFCGMLSGGHTYFPGTGKNQIQRNGKPVTKFPSSYLTDFFTDEAIRWMGAKDDKPFFLYLSYNAPHTPMEATEEDLKAYSHIEDKNRRTYAAMIRALDCGVGRVLDWLKTEDKDSNTLVVFLSDNGGGKGSLTEGGIRVPFAAQWPGRIPKGLVYQHPVISLDILATIAALANAPLDPARPLDGVNLMPFLTGEKSGAPHDALYFRMFDIGAYAVRGGGHKLLIEAKNTGARLYDLKQHVGETKDLAGSKPEALAELEKRRIAWDAQLIAPVFRGLETRKKGQAAKP